MLDLVVNGKPLVMELDTGASVSLVSEKTWKRIFLGCPLEPSEVHLSTYSGEGLKVLGEKEVKVQYGSQEVSLPLIVVEGTGVSLFGRGVSLFGRNWLKAIKIDWGSIKQLHNQVDEVLSRHQKLFQDELGTLQGVPAKLSLKPEAKPKFCRAHMLSRAPSKKS